MPIRNREVLRNVVDNAQDVAALDRVWEILITTSDEQERAAALIAAIDQCPRLEVEFPALEWQTPLSILRAIAEQYNREKNSSN